MGLTNFLRKRGFVVDAGVFIPSVVIIFSFLLFTLLNLSEATAIFSSLKTSITTNFGWFFTLSVQIFLFTALYFAFGRFGKVRLGGKYCKPEYSLLSWFAMLFSAGMGIGLMFWGVGEPVSHFVSPPFGEPRTVQSAQTAFQFTFLHWGLHAWSVYAIVGLTLAYKAFNRGRPLTIRSAFYPIFGEKLIDGWLGKSIDVMAVVATLFGIATSLGFGASQVSAGLDFLFGIEASNNTKLIVVIAITCLATISVISGVDRGVKLLSQINLVGATCLMLFVFLVGPTVFLIKSFLENSGEYLTNFFSLVGWNASYEPENTWHTDWTIFYWAWWVSWSPFVGMFIARISKGRTIREFVLGVLLAPTIVTLFWLNTFGGTGIYSELFGVPGIADAVSNDIATALYVLLQEFPFGQVASFIAIFIVVIFFVTSSDSGSLVIDVISSNGELNPPVKQRVFWALAQGAIAAILMAGGGLLALQTASIIAGLPFTIVLLLMIVSLSKMLKQDFPAYRKPRTRSNK